MGQNLKPLNTPLYPRHLFLSFYNNIANIPYQSKTNCREHSKATVLLVWTLYQSGLSAPKIKLATGLPKSTITFIIRRLKNTKNQKYKKSIRTERPRKLNQRAERRLVRSLHQNPFATLESLSTPSKSGYRLHHNTVRQYLAKNKYYAFRPRRKPYLTPKHKQNRLIFARKMRNWKLSDMACICFSDEFSFEVGLRTNPSWVRRKRGHAFESRYLKPTFKSGRSSVGVWGAISLDFKSVLTIISRGQKMNSKQYIRFILNEKAHPFREKIMEYRGDIIWQEDGARYHTLGITRKH